MALVGMSIVEQRYQAVMAVLAGDPVTEVAAKVGVSRQSVHAWLRRYGDEGLAGLQDRSHRPDGCAHQASPEVEALVCELRRHHPKWGSRRIAFELGPPRLPRTGAVTDDGLSDPDPSRADDAQASSSGS